MPTENKGTIHALSSKQIIELINYGIIDLSKTDEKGRTFLHIVATDHSSLISEILESVKTGGLTISPEILLIKDDQGLTFLELLQRQEGRHQQFLQDARALIMVVSSDNTGDSDESSQGLTAFNLENLKEPVSQNSDNQTEYAKNLRTIKEYLKSFDYGSILAEIPLPYIIKAIQEEIINFRQTDKYENNFLHMAACYPDKFLEILKTSIVCKEDLNHQNKSANRVLDLLCYDRKIEGVAKIVADKLLELGALYGNQIDEIEASTSKQSGSFEFNVSFTPPPHSKADSESSGDNILKQGSDSTENVSLAGASNNDYNGYESDSPQILYDS